MATVYRPAEMVALLRPSLLFPRLHRQPPVQRHGFVTASSTQTTHSSTNGLKPGPHRKPITFTGDTGQVPWSNLSPGEKVVRTTQQSFHLAIVVVGILATGSAGYFLFYDVISPSSQTAYFNRATTRIRGDARCQRLLGPGSQISAHGERSWSRWTRNQIVGGSTEKDQWGTEHMRFRFYVEGPRGQGVVHVHLVRRPSQEEYEYETLAVHVKGHHSIDLVASDKKDSSTPKIFGAKWW